MQHQRLHALQLRLAGLLALFHGCQMVRFEGDDEAESVCWAERCSELYKSSTNPRFEPAMAVSLRPDRRTPPNSETVVCDNLASVLEIVNDKETARDRYGLASQRYAASQCVVVGFFRSPVRADTAPCLGCSG